MLSVDAFTGALNTGLDTDGDGVLDSSPLSSIADCVGVIDGGSAELNDCSVVLGVAFDGQAFVPGSASRIPNGPDTDSAADWVRNDFDLAALPGQPGTLVAVEAVDTPGSTNRVVAAQPVPEPGTAALLALALVSLGWSRRRCDR